MGKTGRGINVNIRKELKVKSLRERIEQKNLRERGRVRTMELSRFPRRIMDIQEEGNGLMEDRGGVKDGVKGGSYR